MSFSCSRARVPHRAFIPANLPRLLIVVSLLASSPLALAWGPEAHRLVIDWTLQTLPPGVQGYFQANRQILFEHANDPERWTKNDRYEQFRHYIYLDTYGRFPYLKLPHVYKEAVARYGKGRIGHNGTLPWQIGEYSLRLTNDFRQQKWNQALEDAAALGFYVTEAHDPLQTTENHNGQLTGQTGLAARFGTELVDRYKNFIFFRATPAVKINDPTEYAFQTVLEANTWVNRILFEDRNALDSLPDYNDDYYDRFYTSVSSILMQELGRAAHDAGSYWYTAWLNAGQPPLPAH
ncbi:MAG TPA: hypothetical protein VFZ08_14595 [Terriglobia bacterium]|nr:hypothetical protein [Terriglobia bacterium]